MRVLVPSTIGLLAMLTGATAAAGQEQRIGRAIAAEASRLASLGASDGSGSQRDGWMHVVRLEPGANVTVFSAGQPTLTAATFVSADDDSLVVLTPGVLAKRGAQTSLTEFAIHNPSLMMMQRGAIEIGDLVLGPDGVFVNGSKVAEYDALVHRIPRADVVRISTLRVNRMNRAAAGTGGTLGGFFLGAVVGRLFTLNCHCDDPGLVGALIGAPIGAIAGGVLAASQVKAQPVEVYHQP